MIVVIVFSIETLNMHKISPKMMQIIAADIVSFFICFINIMSFHKYYTLLYTILEVKIMKVAVLLDNGFEELEAMGPIALLRRGGLDVDMIGVNNKNSVMGRFGVTYSSVYPMNEYDFSKVDCLILPGGPHYQKLENNEAVLKLVHEFAKNKVLAAICASPTILGHEGILKGKKYTCFKNMDEDFGGEYQYAYTVTDGNIITGVRAAASIEFAFAILAKLCGKEHTDKVKASIYYDAQH